jgi:hypothetical protein
MGFILRPAFVAAATKAGVYMHTFSGGYERYGKGKTDLAFSYNHFIATNKTHVPYSPISNEIFFTSAILVHGFILYLVQALALVKIHQTRRTIPLQNLESRLA